MSAAALHSGDLYAAAGPVVDVDMLDVDGAARQAIKLAGPPAPGARHRYHLAAVDALPFRASLTPDAFAAIATRVWTLTEGPEAAAE